MSKSYHVVIYVEKRWSFSEKGKVRFENSAGFQHNNIDCFLRSDSYILCKNNFLTLKQLFTHIETFMEAIHKTHAQYTARLLSINGSSL